MIFAKFINLLIFIIKFIDKVFPLQKEIIEFSTMSSNFKIERLIQIQRSA